MMLKVAILTVTVVSAVLGSAKAADASFMKVSKTVSIGDYIPHDLVTFRDKKVAKRIVPDLEKLLQAAQKDGIILKVSSGYRSYADQVNTFNRWTNQECTKNPKLSRKEAEEIANTYSARPGHSEHQLGTVVDVLSSENNYRFSSDPKLKYIDWIEKNAQKFNFKISYPKSGTEYVYEPWHIRWYPPTK